MTAVVVDVRMGGCNKVPRVDRAIRLCLAPVLTMTRIRRRLMVIGIKVNDGLRGRKEGRPSRTFFILSSEMSNGMRCGQVGYKSSK